MKKIRLAEYKKTQVYMFMFDEMMKARSKEKAIIKEELLKQIEINPSSFRRSKASEQEVGGIILGKFAKYFGMRLVTNDFISELEHLFNNIYFDINYRIYYKKDHYIKTLDRLIEEKPIVLPLIKLMKIFLEMYSKEDIEKFIKRNNEEFNELEKYISFFNEDMIKIYNLLKLIFCKHLTMEMKSQKYSSGLSYSVISLRHKLEGSYFESIFFAQKAKEIFLLENNFKRVMYINFTILNDFSLVVNYDDYYKLAIEQLYTIRSFYNDKDDKTIEDDIEYKTAIKHVVVASLAMKKYKKVCQILENKPLQTLSEVATLLVAKYYVDRDNFEEWYKKEIIEDNKDNPKIFVLDLLIDYLENPDKKKMLKIEETRLLMKSLTNILRNM